MKKIITIVIVVLVALAGVGGGAYYLLREKTPEEQLVGTWYNEKYDVTITFKSDKTLEVVDEGLLNSSDNSREGTWRIAGNQVKFDLTSGPKAMGELPKGEIKSIYFNIYDQGNSGFHLYAAKYEKQ